MSRVVTGKEDGARRRSFLRKNHPVREVVRAYTESAMGEVSSLNSKEYLFDVDGCVGKARFRQI